MVLTDGCDACSLSDVATVSSLQPADQISSPVKQSFSRNQRAFTPAPGVPLPSTGLTGSKSIPPISAAFASALINTQSECI